MASAPAPSSVPAAAPAAAAPAAAAVPKKRGSYNCGRCGLPKKGHVCSVPGPAGKGGGEVEAGGAAAAGELKPRRALHFDDDVMAAQEGVTEAVPLSVAAPMPRPPPEKKARVEVVVDDDDADGEEEEEQDKPGWVDVGAGRRVPGEVVVEVLRRLSPRGVAASAAVSRGWRGCARRVWRAAEEVRLLAAGVRPVSALLTRCPALSRLVLRMDR